MKPAVYLNDGAGRLIKADFYSGPGGFLTPGAPFTTAAISGMWRFTFTSDGLNQGPPSGVLVDSGFVTWHDDGTELMNSGRAPATGSLCMGVWKQTGFLSYKVNHWALSWVPGYPPTPAGSVDQLFEYAGPANIQQSIQLSRDGNSYTGHFTLTAYYPAPPTAAGQDVTKTAGVAAVITGTVSATRITVN
ncbi:MAG TPA: hypothetical protein VLW26_04530 [Steroidobacteraceae bacterium]|nr:hypothetical protein [Steroidobacteraceae bacterium]